MGGNLKPTLLFVFFSLKFLAKLTSLATNNRFGNSSFPNLSHCKWFANETMGGSALS